MPSPTSSTRPTSRTSIWDWYCSISCCRTEAISSALNLIDAPVNHLLADVFEPAGDGTVVDGVADPEHDAADQVGIDEASQDRLTFECRAQLVFNSAGQFGVQRRGRG